MSARHFTSPTGLVVLFPSLTPHDFPRPSLRLPGKTSHSLFHLATQAQTLTTFQPYSKYPPCFKDVTFWLPEENFHNNDLFEAVRDVAGDLVEEVTICLQRRKKSTNADLLDSFKNIEHEGSPHRRLLGNPARGQQTCVTCTRRCSSSELHIFGPRRYNCWTTSFTPRPSGEADVFASHIGPWIGL